LLSYYSDVDRDGFDAIFDDRDHVERTQLKKVIGGTTSWDTIRKYPLRPTTAHRDSFYPAHFSSPGVEGSVVVTEISVEFGNATLTYWFTHILVIYAISQQNLNRPAATRTTATNLLNELRHDASAARVPRSMRESDLPNDDERIGRRHVLGALFRALREPRSRQASLSLQAPPKSPSTTRPHSCQFPPRGASSLCHCIRPFSPQSRCK
jgi:hypothetical protein